MSQLRSSAGGGGRADDFQGRRFGRYEVLSRLAAGGMATVYVARAQGLAGFERLVAIKVLHPHLAHEEEFITMFLDEARLAARIRHPNVVATLDISDSPDAGFFIVMDYIEGDHLGTLIRRAVEHGTLLAPPVVCRIVLDALSGLSAAHALCDERAQPLHLVHRDVSPQNVMVGADGVSRLTDFGVARAEVRLSSTRDGQFKGKLSYMAPEQASTGKADQRSDLFSAGIVLWEALTGRRLFRGETNAATLNMILRDPIPAPSAFAPHLAPFDELLARALSRRPDQRFQSAEEMLYTLEKTAQATVGIASSRAVADAMRTYVGDKVAAEATGVRAAIDALGPSEMSEMRARTSTGELSYPGRPSPFADSSAFDSRPFRSGPPRWALVLMPLALVGALVGGAAIYLAIDDDAAESTTGAAPAAGVAGAPTQTNDPATSPGAAGVPAGGQAAAPATEGVPEGGDAGEASGTNLDPPSIQDSVPGAAADSNRAGRPRVRHGRGAKRRPRPEPAASPSMGGGSDDDLLANPYRR